MLKNCTFSYGCQTWSLTRQECRPKATKERMLGQGVHFDLTKEVTERDRSCIMRSFAFYNIRQILLESSMNRGLHVERLEVTRNAYID